MHLLKKIQTQNYAHIVDNFYPDLDWLCNYFKTKELKPVSGINYSGLAGPPPSKIKKTYKKLEEILDCHLNFSASDGQIRAMREVDMGKEKTFVHFDPNRLNIIIYLTDLPSNVSANEAGTFFYKHKGMKQKRFISLNSGKDDLQKSIAYEDTNRLSAWEKWLNVPYQKNRAVIFDGNLYHSPGIKFFGTKIGHCRMIQLFFPTVK